VSQDLVTLIKRRFIARPDVKARQKSNGEYYPVTVRDTDPVQYVPWSNADLENHLNGSATYGHYLLNTDDTCKLFAFDIDFEKDGFLPTLPNPAHVNPDFSAEDVDAWINSHQPAKLREAWLNKKHIARPFMKYQLRTVAEWLASTVYNELELPCLVAYSGHKGVHVYAFLGKSPAADAHEGAQLVIDLCKKFEQKRGRNFYSLKADCGLHLPGNISIETFPKQATIGDSGFGNLMRIPLGRHLEAPKQPTFFCDLTAPPNQLVPVDPIWALTEGLKNPWSRPDE
jgi:hypothetical protein